VGGISPLYSYHGHIVVVQAKGNPAAAIAGAKVMDGGAAPDAGVAAILAADTHIEHRQVAIMARDGRTAARTGRDNQVWAGEQLGKDCLAFGNVLQGPEVVAAMVKAFVAKPDAALADRLIAGLEAGRDAGGQRAPNGRHYSERGAAVKIIGTETLPDIPYLDLRVDMAFDAVAQLRQGYERYAPMSEMRALRAAHPNRTPVLWDWEAENMAANPPPDIFYEPS
jgi:uncharacterized Ntn-hydrolase superfamily protein